MLDGENFPQWRIGDASVSYCLLYVVIERSFHRSRHRPPERQRDTVIWCPAAGCTCCYSFNVHYIFFFFASALSYVPISLIHLISLFFRKYCNCFRACTFLGQALSFCRPTFKLFLRKLTASIPQPTLLCLQFSLYRSLSRLSYIWTVLYEMHHGYNVFKCMAK